MAACARNLSRAVAAVGVVASLACCGDPVPHRPDAAAVDVVVSVDATADVPPEAADVAPADGWSAQFGPDGSTKTCDWGEADPVMCATGAFCASNSRCVSTSACMCEGGRVAVGCDGAPCTDATCGAGQWYCLRPVSRSDGMCAGWPFHVAASTPVYRCTLANDAFVNDTITRLNALWSSEIRACPCESDALNTFCRNNALVLTESPGVIQYDRGLLQSVTEAVGNNIAAGLVLGHETGHTLQLTLSTVSERSIQNELLADCMAGYYLGSLECQNMISMTDFDAAFMSICRGGDMAGTPWWSQSAHGTCEQRQAAVNLGLNGFRHGAAPFVTCRIVGH